MNMQDQKVVCTCGMPALRTSTMRLCKTCETGYAQIHARHVPESSVPLVTETAASLVEEGI